jgi:hypothetical protein
MQSRIDALAYLWVFRSSDHTTPNVWQAVGPKLFTSLRSNPASPSHTVPLPHTYVQYLRHIDSARLAGPDRPWAAAPPPPPLRHWRHHRPRCRSASALDAGRTPSRRPHPRRRPSLRQPPRRRRRRHCWNGQCSPSRDCITPRSPPTPHLPLGRRVVRREGGSISERGGKYTKYTHFVLGVWIGWCFCNSVVRVGCSFEWVLILVFCCCRRSSRPVSKLPGWVESIDHQRIMQPT